MNSADINRKTRGEQITPGSSFYAETADWKTFEALLHLGERIAGELADPKARDTTARWMGHYLAQKIEAAKVDPSLQDECAELILRIWQSRAGIPSGDLLGQYDRLVEPLQDLLRTQRRFFTPGRAPAPIDDPVNIWVKVALDIDKLSGKLIAYAMRSAVQLLPEPDKDILAFADQVEGNSVNQYVRLLYEGAKEEKPSLDEEKQVALNALSKIRALVTKAFSTKIANDPDA